MEQWKKTIVAEGTPIIEAIRALDATAVQILLVTSPDGRLLGTVTDGDIRRGILAGCPLESPVEGIMNRSPVVAQAGTDKEKLLSIMRSRRLHQVPLVDSSGCVVGLQVVDDLIRSEEKDNWVVLMAGGLGTRLRPLTEERPKPLVKVGKKPILEIILENLVGCGFRKFYISVNYKADQIREHFGDGSRWAAEIRYLNESRRLGTAGCLGMIAEVPAEPLLVMNGDLLTRINFGQLLDFHEEHRSSATMTVREYKFQVPFGVVKVDRHRLASIEEKPVEKFFVNAGIYVLGPEVLALVEKDLHLDMPELFDRILAAGYETAVFPLHEYWMDIGRPDDLEKANDDSSWIMNENGEG
ncbi:MAG: nucleotidyltransferase family protein [Candidatus Glassbacteria bacterium]